MLVILSVSGKECDFHTVDLSDENLIRWLSVRGVREHGSYVFELVWVIDSRSTYDSDSWHRSVISIIVIKRAYSRAH